MRRSCGRCRTPTPATWCGSLRCAAESLGPFGCRLSGHDRQQTTFKDIAAYQSATRSFTHLGGAPGKVARMVVGQGMRVVGIGVVIGLAGALALTRYMASHLFQVGAVDPLTFLATALSLLGMALAACLLPARRAAAVDPVTMLRDE